MYTLEICADSEEVRAFYQTRCNHKDDAGVDVYVPSEVAIEAGTVKKVDMGIRCRMVNEAGECVSYYMYPRSSISNTSLMLANSVGIIDAGYRGKIIAAFRNVGNCEMVTKGTRLVQITAPDLSPLALRLVDTLDATERGEGGFGSTGK